MKIKKTIASALLVTLVAMFYAPMGSKVSANDGQETLADFLKTTKHIEASYSYPSMKLAATNTLVNTSTLVAHTPIMIRCIDTITTNEVVNGSTVYFAVVQDVKDSHGRILIKAGTPATAQITFSKPKGRIGQSGEVTVSDFHTMAVDNSYIPLSGSVSAKPDDKMVLSVCLGVLLCPLFLLMKGEDAQLQAGTQKTVYTVIPINVNTSVY